MTQEKLQQKIRSHDARIAIVGLGYVGLPLAIRFAEENFPVAGIDVDETKSEAISSGKSYFAHIENARVARAVEKGFSATTDFSVVARSDVIVICVPTPLGKHREPNLSFVINTVESLKPYLRSGQAVCLESTTYPGTTEEELVPRVEQLGFKVGHDIFIIYSPEREDPGNKLFETKSIPKVVGGTTRACLAVGIEIYSQVIDEVVPVSSTATAEMTKLLENIHRAVNIGLVNELKIVADKMGIDIFEVIKAAASKPFGFTPYYPGPGLGGHCIPVDPFYLTWKAKEFGVSTRFIELAGEINTYMPRWVLGKIRSSLNALKTPVKGSKVLILGIAYKKDTSDTRESPGLEIMDLLKADGALVAYHDPFVPKLQPLRKYDFTDASLSLSPENIEDQDCIVLCADHSAIDYELLLRNAKLIIDTRGVLPRNSDNVISA